MRLPSFNKLIAETEEKGFYTSFSGESMHSNPRFYKYYGWIFWRGSPFDRNAEKWRNKEWALAF